MGLDYVVAPLYLADHVGRQLEQAECVSFIPRVQHTQKVGDVVSAVPCPPEVNFLLEQWTSLS